MSKRKSRTIPYLTQAGLARRAGLQRSAVSEAIRAGNLAYVTTDCGEARLIELEEAQRWMTGRRPKGRPKATAAKPSRPDPARGK